jgi:hypothetical protein
MLQKCYSFMAYSSDQIVNRLSMNNLNKSRGIMHFTNNAILRGKTAKSRPKKRLIGWSFSSLAWKTKPFPRKLPMAWFDFLFWMLFAMIVGAICGGFVIAAYFRSRGWI